MTDLTAVVLAAGVSRRMGDHNKLLLPVAGEPMILRTVRSYVASCPDVVVVTGHDAAQVMAALRPLPIRFVHNTDYAQGQAGSVATGLRAALGAGHVVVGLGDQPALKPAHLDALMAHHLRSGGKTISVPHDGRQRGNPIVIPGHMVGQMLEDRQNPGCGTFTRNRPDLVDLIPLTEPAYFHDVDTPEDYAALPLAGPAMENMS